MILQENCLLLFSKLKFTKTVSSLGSCLYFLFIITTELVGLIKH